MAQSGHLSIDFPCPLLGAKRTSLLPVVDRHTFENFLQICEGVTCGPVGPFIKNQLRRNLVKMTHDMIAISESEISFDEFARLFRDKLQCNNALFLDGGSATSFYSAVLGRNSNFLPLGPIIGVYGPD